MAQPTEKELKVLLFLMGGMFLIIAWSIPGFGFFVFLLIITPIALFAVPYLIFLLLQIFMPELWKKLKQWLAAYRRSVRMPKRQNRLPTAEEQTEALRLIYLAIIKIGEARSILSPKGGTSHSAVIARLKIANDCLNKANIYDPSVQARKEDGSTRTVNDLAAESCEIEGKSLYCHGFQEYFQAQDEISRESFWLFRWLEKWRAFRSQRYIKQSLVLLRRAYEFAPRNEYLFEQVPILRYLKRRQEAYAIVEGLLKREPLNLNYVEAREEMWHEQNG